MPRPTKGIERDRTMPSGRHREPVKPVSTVASTSIGTLERPITVGGGRLAPTRVHPPAHHHGNATSAKPACCVTTLAAGAYAVGGCCFALLTNAGEEEHGARTPGLYACERLLFIRGDLVVATLD